MVKKQETLPLMGANAQQVGGNHYRKRRIQHWDIVTLFGLDYFQGNITKYAFRWRDKGGIQDLEKMLHYAQKYVEVEKARAAGTLTDELYDEIVRELERLDAAAQAAATRPAP